ncbi:hypothetical protein MSAN_00002700 [Mycena sanguinolenta]|uniref:Uncharacterized protein n=1 Tax=Mycena sanguinolenta TaxID=230812 RepID=A0A8H7DKP2_9AGAR|nr:hypothetical protein MSAN_00002700 [Mycena sanguinolenta]
MGAKYLCCLPLRLGVLVISFLQFILSLGVAGLLAAALIVDARDKDENNSSRITSRTKIVMIVVCVIYAFTALISLTGFIGAIRKKESYVGAFLRIIQLFLVIQVAAMVAYFILFFTDKDEFRRICIGDSTDQDVINTCNSSSNLDLWVVIVSSVIPVLFSAYGVYIVGAYARKLREQDAFVFNPGYVRVGEESPPINTPAARVSLCR